MKKQIITTLIATSLLSTSLVHQADAKVKVQSNTDVINALQTLPKDKQARKFIKHYQVTDAQKDDLGFTHYTLVPKAKGKSFKNKEIKVHVNPQGEVVMINGATDASIQMPTNKIVLSKEKAITLAFDALNIEQQDAQNFSGEVIQSAEIIVNKNNQYVYQIDIITTSPKITHYNVQINAETGAIEEKQNLVAHAADTGLGLGVTGSYKSIKINSVIGGYTLEDLTHTGKIATYQFDNVARTGTLVKDTDKTFNATNQKAAVDAHYYAGRVYDYYKNNFGRNSYDGLGKAIPSLVGVNTLVNTNDNLNNAAWLGDKMVYGDGNGTTFRAMSGGLDVVGHELTHGVTQTTAKLVNQGQSGALNESFSDVFAYFMDPQDWLIAEDIYTPAIAGDGVRSLSNPGAYGQPSHMSGYVNTTADYGGIHTNMGIPNKAAYNTISVIGQQKAQQIYYRALTNYLTSNATFLDAKNALIQSARDLYDETTATQIKTAWDQVGVQ